MRGISRLSLLVIAWVPLFVFAGSHQPKPLSMDELARRATFAKKVEIALAERGARVAIVARRGRPLEAMPAGIRYTHVGFALYSNITTADGRSLPGYAFYNLYQNGDRSILKTDYPVDFFSTTTPSPAGVLIPEPELQRRLITIITGPLYRGLHRSEYSVLANPYDRRFQNCTEFVIDVITAALYQTDDLAQIKANERAHFNAHRVRLSQFKLRLGVIFRDGIRTSDHDGPVYTATFQSIENYLKKHHALLESFEMAPGLGSL
ncbi:MAG: DUF2145 domain-containing protein [Pseudomonadota bacterium]